MFFHKAPHVSAAGTNLLTVQNFMFSYTPLYSMPPWLNVLILSSLFFFEIACYATLTAPQMLCCSVLPES